MYTMNLNEKILLFCFSTDPNITIKILQTFPLIQNIRALNNKKN